MAEENYMNQGPAVSPQEEVKAEQNKRQRTGSGSSSQEGTLKAVELRNEPKVDTGCRCERSNLGRGQRGRPDVKAKY